MKATNQIGVVSCDYCGHPLVTFDVDRLAAQPGWETIQSNMFSYIRGSGTMAHMEIRCSDCGHYFVDSIRKAWAQLQRDNEWDEETNE